MKFNDLTDLSSRAMHRAFDRMVEMGADPALEAEAGDLTLLCEEGSAALCLLVHRQQVGTGEVALSLAALPGEGEREFWRAAARDRRRARTMTTCPPERIS